MAKTLAPKTRTLVAKLVAALPDTRRDPDTVFERLEALHADTLAEEQRDINRLMVTGLINQNSKQRGRATSADENQIDFWRKNPLRKSVTIIQADGKKARRSPYDMTYVELEQYADDHSSARPPISKEVSEIRKTLDALRTYAKASPHKRIGDLWQEKREAEG
jgi:hypothetical protein